MRKHHLEGVLAHDRFRVRKGNGVRRRRHRPLPHAHHPPQQGRCAEGGVLPRKSTQLAQPAVDGPNISRGHLLSGLPRRDPAQEPQDGHVYVLDQALLHVQHPHHPPDRARFQRLLFVTAWSPRSSAITVLVRLLGRWEMIEGAEAR